MGGKRRNKNKSRIFTSRATGAGGWLAGPWAATYFYYKNFRAIKQDKYAKLTLLIGLPLPFLIIGLNLLINASRITTIAYTFVFFIVWRRYMPAIERANKKLKGGFYSAWHALFAAIVLGVVYVAVVGGGIVFIYKQTLPGYLSNDQVLGVIAGTYSRESINKYDETFTKFEANDKTYIAKLNFLVEYPDSTDDAGLNSELEAVEELAQENYQLMSSLANLKGVPKSYNTIVDYHTRFAQYRLTGATLLKQYIATGDEKYLNELKEVSQKGNETMRELKQLIDSSQLFSEDI